MNELNPSSTIREFVQDGDRILQSDCIEALRNQVKPGSVDLIFADPPYNIGKNFNGMLDRWSSNEAYASWCEEWLQLCVKSLSLTGSMYIMTSTQAMPYLDCFLRERVEILSRIVWHYDSSGVQAKKYYGSLYEPILHCVKNKSNYTFNSSDILVEAKTGAKRKLIDYRGTEPKPYKTKKVPGNVWYYPRVRYRMPEYEEHPTQKPESMISRIVLASSNPGDVVMDPFSGSFTTCAVSKKLGRKFIGIEQDIDYVKIGLRRCGFARNLDGQQLNSPVKIFTRQASSSENSAGLFAGKA